jgi:hypothetical protein
MRSLINYFYVIPTHIGIQQFSKLKALDSGFRRNDGLFSGSL